MHTYQNATLLEIICHGSYVDYNKDHCYDFGEKGEGQILFESVLFGS